jgi:hypothetical protein
LHEFRFVQCAGWQITSQTPKNTHIIAIQDFPVR